MRWLKIGFIVLGLSLSSAFAASAEYRKAYNLFGAGDLPAARSLLENLVVMTPQGKELEEVRKLLGICRFLTGDRSGAREVFQQVLSRNSKARLNQKDVLTPEIGQLFEAVRQTAHQAARPVVVAPPKTSRPVERLTPSKRVEPVAERAPKKAVANILVTTNAKRATIFVDDIFVGKSDQTLSVDPGPHEVSISAEGYEEAKKNYTFKLGETLKIHVNLKKAGQEEVVPVVAAGVTRAAVAAAPKGKGVSAGGRDFESGKQKSSFNFNDDLPKPKAPLRPMPPPPQEAPAYQQPAPAYQQPAPAYQQPAPAYQQPAPAYQQPAPAYQQPAPAYQQPAPVYQQPAPVYQQPVYQQPAPVYQQPVYQQPAPVYQQPVYVAPQPTYQAPAYSQPQRHRKIPKRSPWIAMAPLGAGQFQNEQYVKAVLFAGAQVGGIGWGYFNMTKVNAWKASQSAQPAAGTEGWDADYATKAKAYQSGLELQMMIGFAGAGAAWLIGILDAYANITVPGPSSYSFIDHEEQTLSLVADRKAAATQWQVAPGWAWKEQKNYLALSLKVNF